MSSLCGATKRNTFHTTSTYFRHPGVSVLVTSFVLCYCSSGLLLISATTTSQSAPQPTPSLHYDFFWNYFKSRYAPKVLPELTEDDKETKCKATNRQLSLEEAKKKSQDIILSNKDEISAPCIVVGVSVNGENVWSQGFGVSSLETRAPCTPNTVMRIASISKSVTMAVVAKLWEEGRLDLDVPVQEYVTDYPRKEVDGVPVNITCRHLVSHLSGIRHYMKKGDVDKRFRGEEFLQNKRYNSVADSLKVFENDDLFFKPGEKYLYSTYGYVLLSAVIEKIMGEPFPDTMTSVFREFGMTESCLDFYENLIYNRANYYTKSLTGRIQNAPYVDNSNVWAGGGFLSTVGDLLRFGNIMLYSYQHSEGSSGLPGFLKRETVQQMWASVPQSIDEYGGGYGMGWGVCPQGQVFGGRQKQRFCASHSGGAVGASSILHILPPDTEAHVSPRGVAVAIITNIEGANLSKAAGQIASLFERSDIGFRA